MLMDTLQKMGFRGILGAHWIPWETTVIGGNYNPEREYDQSDPNVIRNQIQIAVMNRIMMFAITYQGPFSAFQHKCTMALVAEIEKWAGFRFCFILDPWDAKEEKGKTWQQNLIDTFAHPDVLRMLNSKSYIPEGALGDFNVEDSGGHPVDYSQIPQIKGRPIWGLNTGFSWPKADGKEDPIVALKRINALPTMMAPGICNRFFDGGMPTQGGTGMPVDPINKVPIDMNQQNWGTPAAKAGVSRYLPDRAGLYMRDQLAVTPMNKPYIFRATWNDYNERTAIEPELSIESGIFLK